MTKIHSLQCIFWCTVAMQSYHARMASLRGHDRPVEAAVCRWLTMLPGPVVCATPILGSVIGQLPLRNMVLVMITFKRYMALANGEKS